MLKFVDGKPAWPAKGANEVKDYGWSWEPEINDDTDQLASFTATVTKGSISVVKTGVTTYRGGAKNQTGVVWLSGGNVGDTCTIHIEGTTLQGRELEQTIALQIKDK